MKLRHFIPVLLLAIGASAAQFTVSKSMIGSSGSFSTAGFTVSAFTYAMSNNIVAGFTGVVSTNQAQLLNGGITSTNVSAFIFVNSDPTNSVTLSLTTGATNVFAVIGPTHGCEIEGCAAVVYAVSNTNSCLCSWAWADR